MSKRSLGALIVLNLVLFIGLAVVSLPTEPARAQFGGGPNYLMISGQTVGRDSQDAVYVAELSTAKVVALFINTANNTIEVVAGRDVRGDFARGGAVRP